MPANWILHTDRLTLTPLSRNDDDIVIALFTAPNVVGASDMRSTPDALREEMEYAIRRGGNGLVGIWYISLTASGYKLGTAAMPTP